MVSDLLSGTRARLRARYHASSQAGGAHAPGVAPARGVAFCFSGDILVGYEFASSFEEDHTDFDERKTAGIREGRTSLEEVVVLLGPPHGRQIFPSGIPVGVATAAESTSAPAAADGGTGSWEDLELDDGGIDLGADPGTDEPVLDWDDESAEKAGFEPARLEGPAGTFTSRPKS